MASIELPLRVVHNRPFVQLEYRNGSKGRAGIWTYLDTGGGAVLLGRQLREDLDLPPTGAPFQEDGQRLTPTVPPEVMAHGHRLSLDGCRVFGVEHDWVAPAAFGAPAFLPAHFFRQHNVTFDYPKQIFRLDPPGTLWEEVSLPADVHPKTAFVRIELEIGGERLGFLLDTGASYNMVSEAVMREWKAQNPTWNTVTGAYGYAQMVGAEFEAQCRMIRVPEARLGHLELTDICFVTRAEGVFERYISSMTTAPVVGALAGNVLRHLCVTVDYQRKRMALTPDQTHCGDDLQALGLSLLWQAGTFVVQAIAEAADERTRQLVRLGDEVVTAGGTHLRDLGLTEAVDTLRAPQGTMIDLLLRRAGELKSVQLKAVALL